MDWFAWQVVRYGRFVWPIAVALCVVVGIALRVLWARFRRWAELRALRSSWGRPAGNLSCLQVGTTVVLEGTLRASGERVDFIDDGLVAVVNISRVGRPVDSNCVLQAELLSLEAREAEIGIDAEVEVVAGSREYRWSITSTRLPLVVRDRLPPEPEDFGWFTRRGVVSRSLSEGEKVLVRGVLRTTASEATSYRRPGMRFSLQGVAPGPGTTARVQARPNARPAAPFRWRPILLHSCVGAIAAGCLFSLIPLATQSKRDRNSDLRILALRATSPFSRREALLAYRSYALSHIDLSGDGEYLERAETVEAELGEPRITIERWIRQGQSDRAVKAAHSNSHPALQAWAYYLSGEFTKASDTWEIASGPESPFHAHSWCGYGKEIASVPLGLWIHLLANQPSRSLHALEQSTGRALLGECLGKALESQGGSESALVQLQRLVQKSSSAGCSLLLLENGLAQLENLSAALHPLDNFRLWRSLLLLEQEAPTEPLSALLLTDPTILYINPMMALVGTLPGVQKSILTRPRSGQRCEPQEAKVAALQAAFESVSGRHDRARTLAERSLSCVERGDDWTQDRALMLSASVELAAGNTIVAETIAQRVKGEGQKRLDVLVSVARTGDLVLAHSLFPYVGPEKAAWRKDVSGVPIAAALEGQPLSLEILNLVRLKAPTLEDGRSTLLPWLQWARRETGEGMQSPPSPLRQLVLLRSLAETARHLGDLELSQRYTTQAERFSRALEQRQTSLLLALAAYAYE